MSALPVPPLPILLVDDEEQALRSYDLNLRYSGLTNTIRCADPREVRSILARQEVSLVMLDLGMPQMKGEDVLEFIKKDYPHIPVIIVTGYDEVETAVRCMRAGSVNYLVKPVDRAHLLSAVRHALDSGQEARGRAPRQAESAPGAPGGEDSPLARIVTRNARMKELLAYLEAVAGSDEPVLVTGETGVGKEMVARVSHAASGRTGKFVGVNVAGLDDAMFSDTLFGHKKGAFTGASVGRRGLIEEAAGGTLFLDEIGDLEKASQLKLLRLLQEREYYQLGSDTLKAMEARVVVATNQPLERLIDEGRFRGDLFFRLRTHRVSVPPLRERLDDLEPLCAHFLAKAAQRLGKPAPAAPDGLTELLRAHPFPGNVRELEAMVFNAVALCEGELVSLEPFRAWVRQARPLAGQGIFPGVIGQEPAGTPSVTTANAEPFAVGGDEPVPTLKQAEERLIRDALERAGGSQSRAARMLGITRQALNRRLLLQKRKSQLS
ncbi:Transcriptional regulatory protein ZraR [Fundidesulfovibrio magnetotacticus]|uniref:Transcriptional regulatory protein ZraR n=1 Tax=Fundidesulfovibrio magnetotacticus TaxID=2730080 RepID=A0A6V8LPT6_9BACT|nr:sigma-54 dependent transcriptional regulator [Fundidesulfovibrio magnetotacticus]GFK92358.1 Transcriptional regulatory protein ZraR [Fundidesulfovibrio magnetotacticus]